MALRMPAVERREQLLDAALALVAHDGFHRFSMEAVARQAGVTRPVVYGHFGDLPGLIEALVEREEERAVRQLEAVLPDITPGRSRGEALLAGFRAYLDAVRAEPATWRLVLMPPEGTPDRMRKRIAEGRALAIGRLAALVAAGSSEAGDASPDPELTAWTLSVLSDEAARLVLTDPERYSAERLAAHAAWLVGRLG